MWPHSIAKKLTAHSRLKNKTKRENLYIANVKAILAEHMNQ